MDFDLTPEQTMLRDTLRGFLDTEVPMARVRRVAEGGGLDLDAWRSLAELGILGLAVPEDLGGAGAGFLETCLVAEELGRTLTPVPYLSTAVLGVHALLLAGGGPAADHVPAAVAGERLVSVVAADGPWETGRLGVVDEDGSLSGRVGVVVDGADADMLVVAARRGAGVTWWLVDPGSPGVARRVVEGLDPTRRLAEVVLDGVTGTPLPGDAAMLERLADLAAVALAFEQVGGAQRCLEMSVAYAKERRQFGRPIGSFQAVKHRCADMLVRVESARSAALYAGWAADEAAEELPVVAALARAYCSEAYSWVAEETVFTHGGLGFTWEHDAHLYLKRAKVDRLLLGDPVAWRARLAGRVGL